RRVALLGHGVPEVRDPRDGGARGYAAGDGMSRRNGVRAPYGLDATVPDRADACPYTPEPPAGPAVGRRGEPRVALGDGQVTGGIQAERADYFVARRSRRRGLIHCLVGGGPNGEYSRLPAVLGQ